MVPILLTRLAKGKKNATTVALAASCAGSFVAFKRVHPLRSHRWPGQRPHVRPYDILQIRRRPTRPSSRRPTAASLADGIRTKGAMPRPSEDPECPSALAGDVTGKRRNRRDFGHPDGPRLSFAGAPRRRTASRRRCRFVRADVALVLLPVLRLATTGAAARQAPCRRRPRSWRCATRCRRMRPPTYRRGSSLDEVGYKPGRRRRAAVAHDATQRLVHGTPSARRYGTQSPKTSTRRPASLSSRPSRASRQRPRSSSNRWRDGGWTRTAIPGRSTSPRLWPARPSSSRAARVAPLANLQTAIGAVQCLCAPKRFSLVLHRSNFAVFDDDEA